MYLRAYKKKRQSCSKGFSDEKAASKMLVKLTPTHNIADYLGQSWTLANVYPSWNVITAGLFSIDYINQLFLFSTEWDLEN